MTNQSDIKKLAEQMASSMKSFDDIKDFQKQLMQSFIDTALEAEMEEHLGYPKHEKADRPNKRNGHTKKRVRSDTGELEISTPRDHKYLHKFTSGISEFTQFVRGIMIYQFGKIKPLEQSCHHSRCGYWFAAFHLPT